MADNGTEWECLVYPAGLCSCVAGFGFHPGRWRLFSACPVLAGKRHCRVGSISFQAMDTDLEKGAF